MYSIHDSAVNVFLPPHYTRTEAEAERNFVKNVKDPENGHLHTSAQQFNLFHVGEYDDESGQTIPACPPRLVMAAITAKSLE